MTQLLIAEGEYYCKASYAASGAFSGGSALSEKASIVAIGEFSFSV